LGETQEPSEGSQEEEILARTVGFMYIHETFKNGYVKVKGRNGLPDTRETGKSSKTTLLIY
jgi:hypothetical protein